MKACPFIAHTLSPYYNIYHYLQHTYIIITKLKTTYHHNYDINSKYHINHKKSKSRTTTTNKISVFIYFTRKNSTKSKIKNKKVAQFRKKQYLCTRNSKTYSKSFGV